jgi:hypothetical protein
MDKAMTEAANIERQKRRQAEFVNDQQRRLFEIEDMRLVVKWNAKRSTKNSSRPGSTTKQGATPDAIAAIFKKLDADDEVERARRDLGG